MGEAMEMADLTIENTETLAAFQRTVRTLIRDGPEALDQ